MMRLVLLALLGLAACAQPGPPPPISAAAAAGPSNGPIYNAALGAFEAFRSPAALAGRPADAALAVERLEYLAAIPYDASGSPLGFSQLTGPALQGARYEVRRSLGIATDAPPTAVVTALVAAREALVRGDTAGAQAALASPTFAPGTLVRLSNLGRSPTANSAILRLLQDIEFGSEERREWGSAARDLSARG